MVGGERAAVEAAWPVFETFAGRIVHLGGVGAGQSAKLVNNTLMAAHFAIAHHALVAGEQLGIDRQALAELVALSSGRSFCFDVHARHPSLAALAPGAQQLRRTTL